MIQPVQNAYALTVFFEFRVAGTLVVLPDCCGGTLSSAPLEPG